MREIFLCDLNNFYASCEIAKDNSLKGCPVAVSGSVSERKGVVIARNYLAKDYGVKAGDIVFEAKQKCPNLIIKECDFELYNYYSKKVREIYLKYTDRVEPFSIDECFLDVTNSKIFGNSYNIAYKIKEEVKKTLGLTLSIGISFNKTFAKIASEFKKPDAISVVTKEDYKEKIWSLKIEEMVGVGKRLKEKLNKYGLFTIKDLANCDEKFLTNLLGKVGKDLHNYSNGEDYRIVDLYENYIKPKSVGNSTTFYKDLTDYEDIVLGFSVISENIVKRMIKYNLIAAKTMHVHAKDSLLNTFSKQITFNYPTRNSNIITNKAVEVFYKYFKLKSIRQLGLKLTNFVDYEKISFFENKQELTDVDNIILKINEKFNDNVIFKANNLRDKKMASSFNRPPLIKK